MTKEIKNLVKSYTVELVKEASERAKSQDRSPFFTKLRNVFLGAGIVGGAILTTSSIVAFPPLVLTIGGYLVVAGSVGTAFGLSKKQ